MHPPDPVRAAAVAPSSLSLSLLVSRSKSRGDRSRSRVVCSKKVPPTMVMKPHTSVASCTPVCTSYRMQIGGVGADTRVCVCAFAHACCVVCV